MRIDMGADKAKLFGDMHEDGDRAEPDNERVMDTSNNAKGREVGTRSAEQAPIEGSPRVDWAEGECLRLAEKGLLVTIG